MKKRQHKLAAIALCALLLLQTVFVFGIPAGAETTSDTPTITVGSAEVKPGDTVTLPVTVTNNPGIGAFTFSFEYDSSVLTLVSVTRNSDLGGTYSYDENFVWLGSSKGYSEDGTILELKFLVLDGARGELPVSVAYGPGDICNWELESIDFDVVPGTLTVNYDPCESGHSYSGGICSGCGQINPTLSPALSVSSVTAAAGNTARVVVSLESAPVLRSLMISDITYDEGLELLSMEWLLSGVAITDTDADAGFAIAAMTDNSDLCGELLALTFRVPSGTSDGDYSVSVSGTAKIKPEGYEETTLAIAGGSGAVTVGSLRGDINRDGAIDSDDAIQLLGYTFDDTGLDQSGDMNGDGAFDSDDAIYLLMYTFDPEIYPLAE